MRIAFAIQHYPPYLGGAERQAAILAPAMAEHCSNVTVVSTRFSRALPPSQPDGKARIVRLPTPASRPAKYVVNLLSSFVYFLFTFGRFDLVHAHCLSPFTLGAILASRLRPRPILVKICSVGALGEALKIKSSRLKGPILWWLFKKADLIIAPTEIVADELAREGIPRHKLRVVPNLLHRRPRPPNTGDRKAARAALALPERLTLLYVGRLSPEKGLDRLMDIWPTLARNHDIGLLIVGDGPERARIEAWRDQHGLGDSVEIPGYQKDPEPYFQAADIFVFPSRSETFGNAIVEAMSYGLAVATTEVGVVKEWDGFEGICRLDNEDPEHFRRQLSELISDPGLRRQLGSEAYGFVAERYRVEAGVRQYQALYHGLLGTLKKRL